MGEKETERTNSSDDVIGDIDPLTENIIKEALKSFVEKKYNKRKTDDEIEAMVSVCSEFLKCFIIMGYDFNGNSIKPIFYAKNEVDSDALKQYIHKFILNPLH